MHKMLFTLCTVFVFNAFSDDFMAIVTEDWGDKSEPHNSNNASPRNILQGPEKGMYVSWRNGIYSLLDSMGKEIWSKSFPEPFGGNEDIYLPMSVTPDSGLYVTSAELVDTGNGTLVDGLKIYRLDREGNEVWSVVKGDFGGNRFYPTSVATTSDGGCLITGNMYSFMFLVRLNANGEVLLNKFYPAFGDYTQHNFPHWVEPTQDGGMLVTGELQPTMGWGNIWYMKLDSAGEILWNHTISEEEGRGLCIRELGPDSLILLAAQRSGYSNWVLFLDGDGIIQSRVEHTYGNTLFFSNFQPIGESDLLINSEGGYLLRLDNHGELVWRVKTHTGSTPMVGGSLIREDGSIVVNGSNRLENSSYNKLSMRVVRVVEPVVMESVERCVRPAERGSFDEVVITVSFSGLEVFDYLELNPEFDIYEKNLWKKLRVLNDGRWPDSARGLQSVTWNTDHSKLQVVFNNVEDSGYVSLEHEITYLPLNLLDWDTLPVVEGSCELITSNKINDELIKNNTIRISQLEDSRVQLQMSDASPFSAVLFNLQGRILKRFASKSRPVTWRTIGHSNGVYFFKINTLANSRVHKFILK